jgi:F-type H+-transporting ATPase subunit b
MRRFLYRPILLAIDEREKRIATEVENAEKRMSDAQQERNKFESKNKEFDQQRAALQCKAIDEVQAQCQKLLDEARAAALTLRSQLWESLRNESHSLHQQIGQRAQQEVFAIARKTLKDLAGADLEEHLGAVFIRRLHEMKNRGNAYFTEAITTSPGPVFVRSAFDLPVTLRLTIQKAINETFSGEILLQFETAPDLIAGIELNANGYKVAWSIDEYLISMEKSIDDILEENDKRVIKAGNEPQKPELEVKKR